MRKFVSLWHSGLPVAIQVSAVCFDPEPGAETKEYPSWYMDAIAHKVIYNRAQGTGSNQWALTTIELGEYGSIPLNKGDWVVQSPINGHALTVLSDHAFSLMFEEV